MRLVNVVFVIIVSLDSVVEIYTDCIIPIKSLNKTQSRRQPVFIQNGELLAPTPSGDIYVGTQEILTVACPGRDRFIVLGQNVSELSIAEAECISNNTFAIGAWNGYFADIKCNKQPWITAEWTANKCYGDNSYARVGYQIQDRFHTLYEACHDKNGLTTLYTRHHVTASSYHVQRGGSRPPFTEGGLFDGVKMNKYYTLKNQKEMVISLMGTDMDKAYFTKKQFLNRGHLTPNADFSMVFSQRGTFNFVNAAPQWMRTNAGDWAALEEAIRRRLRNTKLNLTVFTGIHDVVTLADVNGDHKKLYLRMDENNNPALPVPLYFFKVIYDAFNKAAVAFISINSPFYNQTQIEDLTFCNDICAGNSDYNWLKWRPNDDTFSFCCDYNEFAKEIPFLPELDVDNTFY